MALTTLVIVSLSSGCATTSNNKSLTNHLDNKNVLDFTSYEYLEIKANSDDVLQAAETVLKKDGFESQNYTSKDTPEHEKNPFSTVSYSKFSTRKKFDWVLTRKVTELTKTIVIVTCTPLDDQTTKTGIKLLGENIEYLGTLEKGALTKRKSYAITDIDQHQNLLRDINAQIEEGTN